ncbi:MAG: cytochrome C oxidase subunit IV family protein [bacterium]
MIGGALHVMPKKIYFAIFAALLVLTAVTVWVAFLDLGPLNTFVALAIAALKATLVILFFMHVKYSTRLTKLVVVSGFVWLLILFVLTMGDYASRNWLRAPKAWEEPAAVAPVPGEPASPATTESHH